MDYRKWQRKARKQEQASQKEMLRRFAFAVKNFKSIQKKYGVMGVMRVFQDWFADWGVNSNKRRTPCKKGTHA